MIVSCQLEWSMSTIGHVFMVERMTGGCDILKKKKSK